MEESLRGQILTLWEKEPADIRRYSPLTLAYVGDDVYDLIIRTLVTAEGDASVGKLHKHTASIVKAEAQSQIAHRLTETGYLDAEELDIYRRGRNAKSHSVAKNASVSDYRSATGLEALIGYLYMTDRMDRCLEIIRHGLILAEKTI